MRKLGPSNKMPVMAHLVLGYPTLAESIRTAGQYVQAGVEILELQIPFSHPTADGPVITAACQVANDVVGNENVAEADVLPRGGVYAASDDVAVDDNAVDGGGRCTARKKA